MAISKQSEIQFAGVLWDIKKVAQKLGVSINTIRRWADEGMEGFPKPIHAGPKLLRWEATAILEWIEERKGK